MARDQDDTVFSGQDIEWLHKTMSLQDLANISQIAQTILVIVSLEFIWHQLKEGVRLAKSENARSLAEQAETFNSLTIQNTDLAKLWYSYGQKLEEWNEVDRLRYREMLLQRLIFHEYIYYQHKHKLLDDEIYHSLSAYLERIVQQHNLDVISNDIQNVFLGGFGQHVRQLQIKLKESQDSSH